MQCPRCGWQNPADITACQRCGLAVPGAAPPTGPGYGSPYGRAAPAQPPTYGQAPAYGRPASGQASPYAQPSPYPGYGGYGGGGTPTQGTPYGGPALPWYAPSGATAAPGQTPDHDGTIRVARLLLVLAAVASVVYAVWAMTARRGIFQDFVNSQAVGIGRARTSDHVDTTLLAIAGGLSVLALLLWLVRLMAGRARGGGLAVTGFVASAAGIICVVVGLVLSGTVGTNGDRVSEAHRAITATIVTGAGFVVLALGLVLGLVVANSRRTGEGTTSGAGQQDDRWPTAALGG